MGKSKRTLVGIGTAAVTLALLIFGLRPDFPSVFAAAVIQGTAGSILGPAVAAISLGLVGNEALASSARPSIPRKAPTLASLSPRCAVPPATPARSTKTSTARAARPKTASVSSSSCGPIAPPRPRWRPISCVCGFRRSPTSWSMQCAASRCATPSLPMPRSQPSASSCSSSAPACASVRAAFILPSLQAARTSTSSRRRISPSSEPSAPPEATRRAQWKTAYDACEAAQVLFLRKFGPAMRERAVSPSAFLAMLAKLAALLPSHTRRSEESQALQQFSTPIGLGFVASTAAAITPADVVLEPSAGTGLFAVHAELGGGSLVLNEIAETRADLLDRLFPAVSITRFDAAHIHDHLDAAISPSLVLMNPPFSAAAHVDGRVADAAFRHLSSALARLADGGRLVAITGSNLSPDNPTWRDSFVRLQERGRVVFSVAVDGPVYTRHGTTTETRLTVIDRVPADDLMSFPASPGTASDTAVLLDWVTRLVSKRATVIAPPALARRAAPIAARSVIARLASNTGSRRTSTVAIVEPAAVELAYEAVDWAPV